MDDSNDHVDRRIRDCQLDILTHIAKIEKRVTILEERHDTARERLEKMDKTLERVFNRIDDLHSKLSQHMEKESRDRVALMGGVILTLITVLGSAIFSAISS